MRVPIMDVGPENRRVLPALLARIGATLEEGQLMLGSEVELFEKSAAAYAGADFAVGVNSGTDAIYLSLRALGIGRGDEVITAPNSFVGTAGAIIDCGARPVFADVGPDENLDPGALRAAISSRTRAVVPVHLRGRPARMAEICDIAGQAGIAVVEDAAQAFGTRLDGRHVGTFGVLGCFSFHPQKVLAAAGDGGMVITSDPELAGRLRLLRHHGLVSRDEVLMWGRNSRLDSIQAAVLNVKLEMVDEWIARRRELASVYLRELSGLPLELPVEQPGQHCVFYLFSVMTDQRDALKAHLQAAGVDARVHYELLITEQPAAREMGYDYRANPVAASQRLRQLSLPIYPGLTSEQQRLVIDEVRAFFKEAA